MSVNIFNGGGMDEILLNINWLAIIVGFVVSFVLGWFWYSPKLFGQKWADGVGVKLTDSSQVPVVAMIAQAIATFFLAWLVGITAAKEQLLTIILVILTLAIFIFSNGKYVKKSTTALMIECGYILVMGVIMIICQGIF